MEKLWQRLLRISPAILVTNSIGNLPTIAQVTVVMTASLSSVVMLQTVASLTVLETRSPLLPNRVEKALNQPATSPSIVDGLSVNGLSADEITPEEQAALVDEADMDQVTSVSQLTDVKLTDWAFQALQSLVERYGCIMGYPNKTYRGNRALTRYEFAAGLSACMDRINELIAASTANLVKKDDLLAKRNLRRSWQRCVDG